MKNRLFNLMSLVFLLVLGFVFGFGGGNPYPPAPVAEPEVGEEEADAIGEPMEDEEEELFEDDEDEEDAEDSLSSDEKFDSI